MIDVDFPVSPTGNRSDFDKPRLPRLAVLDTNLDRIVLEKGTQEVIVKLVDDSFLSDSDSELRPTHGR